MEELMRYDEAQRYFDTATNTVGTVKYADEGEPWFHAENGTDSHVVGVGDFLIPYRDFSTLLGVFIVAAKQSAQLALQQQCDKITTTMRQRNDSVATEERQRGDNPATAFSTSSYRDTSAARSAKKPPVTTKQIVKIHAAAVSAITIKGYVKAVSEGVYKDIFALPTNVPQYIVDDINAKGIRRPDGRPYTQETLSPVVAAIKTESRPSKMKIAYTFVLAVILAVLLTRGCNYLTSSTSTPKQTETTQQASKSNQIFVFDADKIKAICKSKGVQLTDYRIGVILGKTFADEAALSAEISRQYNEMLNAMQTKK